MGSTQAQQSFNPYNHGSEGTQYVLSFIHPVKICWLGKKKYNPQKVSLFNSVSVYTIILHQLHIRASLPKRSMQIHEIHPN
jgi:hypothetical protein